MAAAIAMESNTRPVHPNSPRVIGKPFASLRDNTRGRCMQPNMASVGVEVGTFGRARIRSRTPSRKAGNDKLTYTWMQVQVQVQVWLKWRNQRKTIRRTERLQREA